ncbi:hypothetical protein PAXINDRAFT_21037 [Paxillus involutus ATCC 200175]|uniref:Unplaced genomic scaffold PAXINscaffold_1437, whole genome shotgun sequence n=1 Tax=Paxillus involutus ATCC 200175 TaxID=664439 RepID=A0A0C9T2K4_PAXIN|nr:hypothetical protein PAXINDRAFT_21037 [Paxillus involutus ATCC 200175]
MTPAQTVPCDTGSTKPATLPVGHPNTGSFSSKRRRSTSCLHSSDTDEEDTYQKRSKAASQSRAPKKTATERRKQLEDDPMCTNIKEHSIECSGCGSTIKLHPRTPYSSAEWIRHRERCPQISGLETVHSRTDIIPKLPPKGNTLLSSFFTQKQAAVPGDTNTTVPLAPELPKEGATSTSYVSYTTKKIRASRSITSFFVKAVGPRPDPGKTPSDSSTATPDGSSSMVPVQVVCQQIKGDQYNEYIRRIRTCTLGGISPEFRAHAERCLFPYKPFRDLEKQDQSFNMITPASGLTTTNNETEERKWTDAEKKVFDATLWAFARWEVDYANLVIRAVRCEGRTEDPEQICKACRAVMVDESFKRAVRRKAAEAKLDPEQQHSKLVQRPTGI